jgi:hypothetical protein
VDIQGPYNIYGVVMTTDDLNMMSQSAIYGYTWVNDDLDMSGHSDIHLSRCAATRAVWYSNLSRPIPVQGRPWVELF